MAKQKEGTNMTEQIIRCPYCLMVDRFTPMLPRPGGWFICLECGHTANPAKQSEG
jgi:hypothetical protein